MTNTNFESIRGVTGRYLSNLELEISCPPSFTTSLKKSLTMTNNSVAWKVNFLRKKLKYWQKYIGTPIEEQVFIQNPALREQAIEKLQKKITTARAKIDDIEEQLTELIPQIKEELFTEIAPNLLVVPPGLWYMCETIEGNAHLNNDLKPFALLECRTYQFEGLTGLFRYNRATLELATGLGKSKIIQSMAIASVRSKMRAMIVVPSEYLVGQMLTEMKELHANTTAQGGGRQAELGWDILVTTIQSAQGFADLPHVILLDESHHAPAETWTALLCKAENATHVYSFTATAFRADGLDLAIHSFAGPVVYSRDVRWGIENHWLSPFIPVSIKVTPKYSTGARQGQNIFLSDNIAATTAYKIMTSSYAVMQVVRDRLIAGLEKGRKPIVIFKTVEACKAFRKFCSSVLDMDVASAQQGRKSKAPLAKFRKGEVQMLLANSGLVAEGLDFPQCNMIIQVCQNSSDVMTLQILGRMLRIDPDKTNSILIDIGIQGYSQFERASNRRNEVYSKIVGENQLKIITVR